MTQTTYFRAFQLAEASILAPFLFLEIPFSYLVDIIILGNIPDIFSIFGTLLIISVSFIIKVEESSNNSKEKGKNVE